MPFRQAVREIDCDLAPGSAGPGPAAREAPGGRPPTSAGTRPLAPAPQRLEDAWESLGLHGDAVWASSRRPA
jgi:hypothetical protein